MKEAGRKAIQAKKPRWTDEQPLSTESSETPGFSAGLVMRSVNYAKGAVRLSEYYGIGEVPQPYDGTARTPSFGLRWQSMMELKADHGMSTICGILMDADLWILWPARREELLAAVKDRVHENIWAMITERLRASQDEGEGDIRDPLIVGLWAELFVEPLSDLWLAAMAYHAYYAEQNDFAFGYLTAQLDQRQQIEEDFVRGRKSVESGKAGAEIRASNSRSKTERVLQELRRLIDNGHTISRASSIAATAGIGTSPAANRKLWGRHSEK